MWSHVHMHLILSSWFGFTSSTHIIYRQMVTLCHTSKVLVSKPSARAHTQTQTLTHHYPWHTTNIMSLSPCHTTLGPTSLCPFSLPLYRHLPSSPVCMCADIHVCLCRDLCVLDHKWAHFVWNMAASVWPVFLYSFSLWKTLVTDVRGTTTNNSQKQIAPTDHYLNENSTYVITFMVLIWGINTNLHIKKWKVTFALMTHIQ